MDAVFEFVPSLVGELDAALHQRRRRRTIQPQGRQALQRSLVAGRRRYYRTGIEEVAMSAEISCGTSRSNRAD